MESAMPVGIHMPTKAKNLDTAKSRLKKVAPKVLFPALFRNQAQPL